MREKARALVDKIFHTVKGWQYRVVYFFNYHKVNKKALKWGGIVVAGLAVFVTVAALLPEHKYKDTVAMGEFSFTNTEVSSYEDDIKAYYESGGIGVLSDGEGDNRSDYEIAFDDRFRNIALQQKAEECGVELDNSENSPYFNYDDYEFSLIKEQNRKWEKKLEKCVIKAKNVLYVASGFDAPELDRKPQEEADLFYTDAISRLRQIEPLLKHGNSIEDIDEAVKTSNAEYNRVSNSVEEMALFVGTYWCPENQDCLNSDPSIAENETISKPANIVNANDAFNAGLQSDGDLAGLITGDNGVFAYYRLEERTGEFGTWDDYYQSMKDEYAYDSTPTMFLGAIKTVASPFLSMIDGDYASAGNAVRPWLHVYTTAAIPANIIDDIESGGEGVYIGSGYVDHNNALRNTSITPGGFEQDTGDGWNGPLNCVGQAFFREFNAGSYDPIAWEFNNGTGVLRYEGNDATPVENLRWNAGEKSPLIGPYYYWGPPTQANAGVPSFGFNLIVKEPKFQPVASSQVSTTTIPNSSGSYNITDTIKSSTTSGTTWISGVKVRYDADLYYCGSQQTKNPSSGGTSAPSTPTGCKMVATTYTTFSNSGQSNDVTFYGTASNNSVTTDDKFMPQPGWYYIVTKIIKDDRQADKDRIVSSWYTPFADDNEEVLSQFQPQVISSVSSNFYGSGEAMVDEITIREKTGNNNWPTDDSGKKIDVKVCVRVYGPLNAPLRDITHTSPYNGSDTLTSSPHLPSSPKDVICQNMNPDNSPLKFTFNTAGNESKGWPSGYYYFNEYINKNGTGAEAQSAIAKQLMRSSYYSYINPDYSDDASWKYTEWAYRKFQPFAISSSVDGQCEGAGCADGGDYISSGEKAVDYIKVYAADSPNELTNANKGVSGANNNNWPKYSSSGYVPVKYKVHMFGPYQSPQANITNNNATDVTGVNAPNASSPWSSTGGYKVVKVNGVSGDYSTNTGAGVTPEVNALNDGRGLAVDFGVVDKPGYYYYTIEVVRNDQNQTVVLDPGPIKERKLEVSNFITSAYWKSEFNPSDEPEWTYRKFQPFVTSNVKESKTWIDVKESASGGYEKIVDYVMARAAKSADEANNGHQAANDSTNYWPKDGNGDYIPVKFNFYICGPFQYPQDNNGDNMTNPSTNIKCNGNNALNKVSRYMTPDKCGVTATSLNKYGSEDGCEIDFGRADVNGGIYQPGYYYFTSEMLLGEQTGYYVTSSPNPGLSTSTLTKNFILGNWYSKFNPLWADKNTLDEVEWAYVQFQPVARSYMGATQSEESPNENNWTTRLSYLYEKDTVNQYKGLQLNCDEHNFMPTYTDMANDNNFWNKVPSTTLTCKNVSDRVYIGATTTKDIDYSTNVISDTKNDEKNWPKTNHSSEENGKNYETVKYRTKLYGPFASAGVMTGNTLKSNPDGVNVAGKTVTVVPSSNPNVQGLVNSGSQPVAESCLMSAKYGPNYNDFPAYDAGKPSSSLNAYYYQEEKTSIAKSGYYKAVFTRDTEVDCASDGSGSLGLFDSSGVPYTTLSLEPGVYVSVVEVWKSDMNENNNYDTGDTSNKDNHFDDNNQENSASKRGQISKGEVRDLMANDFHSKWGDPYESIFVPPDTDIWTLRGNMQNYKVDWGARYADQYWTAGFSNWCTTYKDLFGNCLQNHSGEEYGYQGEKDYFAPDRNPDEHAGKVKVDLYGAFETRPDTAECPADKRVASWWVDMIDTDKTGNSTKLENMIPSSGDGWYVYVFSYPGDDRIPALQTKCSDPDEQFFLGDPPAPELETQIDIASSTGKAPSVISDTVTVSGWVEKDSVIKLSLYRRGGVIHNPKADTQICSVQFTVPHTSESTKYYVSDYMDKNGYVFGNNTPDDVAADPNRCFAEEEGHYYWNEEFYSPDGDVLKDDPDGPNEWADIEKEKPEVTTIADTAVKVGDPFHDTAYVKIPEGDTKKYDLYMRAYGPTTGAPVCDTTNKTNLLFESGPHEVTKSGTYPSAYTSSLTTGYVYWIESLVDKETNEVVSEGYCGKENEMTRVYDTPAPGDSWEWTTPGAPSAGEIALSAAKIVGLISILGLGAWQLSDKSSWLMRKIGK